MTGETLAAALVQLALAGALLAVGVWGWTGAERFSFSLADPHERRERAGLFRRGAATCLVLGGIFLGAGVIALVTGG